MEKGRLRQTDLVEKEGSRGEGRERKRRREGGREEKREGGKEKAASDDRCQS